MLSYKIAMTDGTKSVQQYKFWTMNHNKIWSHELPTKQFQL